MQKERAQKLPTSVAQRKNTAATLAGTRFDGLCTRETIPWPVASYAQVRCLLRFLWRGGNPVVSDVVPGGQRREDD